MLQAWLKKRRQMATQQFLFLTGQTLTLLLLQLMLPGKILKTMMIQNTAETGMVLKVIKLIKLLIHFHGIYKLALIFHYHSGLTQLKVAGIGKIGIKPHGLQIVRLDLI
jgi:hypothetical protein